MSPPQLFSEARRRRSQKKMTWKKVLKFLKFWNHIQQIWWRLENRAKNWKGCKWSNVHHQHSSCSTLNRLTTDLLRKPLEVPKLECKLVKMRKVYEWMLKIVKHVRSIPPHRALEFKTYIAVDMIYLFSFRNSWVGNGWLSMLEHMDIKMIRTFGISTYLLQNSEQVEKILLTILQTDDDYNNDDIVGWEKILGTFQAQNISKSKLQGWPDFNSSVLFHF